MELSQITTEMLVEAYGHSTDGIRIFDAKNRPVGYITDLKLAFSRDKKRQKKQKEYQNQKTEASREAMPAAVQEMIEFLKNHLAKYDAEIDINITQPNVKLNGCTCYITVEPINGQHRLGIRHAWMTADEMTSEVQGFRISSSADPHHVLWNGLTPDDIVETIIKLCSK